VQFHDTTSVELQGGGRVTDALERIFVSLGQLSKIQSRCTTQHKAVMVVFNIVCDEDVGGRVSDVFLLSVLKYGTP